MTTDIETLTKEKIQLEEPGLWDVIFLNDNITTYEFVIRVLKQIFGKTTNSPIFNTPKGSELLSTCVGLLVTTKLIG